MAGSWRTWAVIAVAVCSTAEMPPLSEQARAGLDRVLGAKGTYVSEESAYKFSFPRTDIAVRVGTQRLAPTQAPKSWATFAPSMSREGMLIGELVLLQDEVNPVLTIALKNGLEVTGLGPTLLAEEPKLLVLNVTGQGTYQALGAALRKALDEIPRVRAGKRDQSTAANAVAAPVPNSIDAARPNAILSMRGTTVDGIYRAAIGRVALINGTPVGREMGMSTTVSIFGTNERAFLDADIIVSPDELQRVLMALRLKALDITAIRNHTVAEHPQVLFVRVWGRGTAAELASALRYALDVEIGAVRVPQQSRATPPVVSEVVSRFGCQREDLTAPWACSCFQPIFM
jgi:hypothetical protein